jgi:hypothetical protein
MSSWLFYRYKELGIEEIKEKNLPVEGFGDVFDIALRVSVTRSTTIITIKISRKVIFLLCIFIFIYVYWLYYLQLHLL